MTKVYVLTSGEYSDYHIVGVFSEKDLIPDLDWCGYRIEEYELNTFASDGQPHFVASITFDKGDITGGSILREDFLNCHHTAGGCWWNSTEFVYEKRINDSCGRKSENYVPAITVYSKESFDHAVKVAVELRQKWLREGSPNPKTWGVKE